MKSIRNFIEQHKKQPSILKNQSFSQEFHRYKVSVRLFIKQIQQEFSEMIDQHQIEKKALQKQIQTLKRQVVGNRQANPIKTVFLDQQYFEDTTDNRSKKSKQNELQKNRTLNIINSHSLNKKILLQQFSASKISQIESKQKYHRSFSPQIYNKNQESEWFDESVKIQSKPKSIIHNLSLVCDDLTQQLAYKDKIKQVKLKQFYQTKNKSIQKKQYSLQKNNDIQFDAKNMLRDLRNTMGGKPQGETKCFKSKKRAQPKDKGRYQKNGKQKRFESRQIDTQSSDEQQKRREQLTRKQELNPTQINQLRKSKKLSAKPSRMYKVNRNYDYIDVLFR